MSITEQIDFIGLENVAEKLRITPNELRDKTNNPKLFTLHELATLMEGAGVTDKMVLLMLDKLKRED